MKSKGCMLIGSNKPLHKQVYLNAVRISKNEDHGPINTEKMSQYHDPISF